MGFLSALHTNFGHNSYGLGDNCPQSFFFFDRPLSLMIEKTRQFGTVTNTFSERCSTLDVIAVKIFQKKKLPFRHNERKRDGMGQKMTDFSMFFGRCDLVFERFKNRPRHFLPRKGSN